jgi:Na+-driven multidrug efflux pump
MVGQNLGAGNTKRAREIALTAAHTIALIVFTGALIVFIFKDQLVSVFTNYVDIAFEAKKLVSIIAWILPLMMLSFLSMSVGRGSGHMLFPTVNNIVRFWLIRIGLGYILAISFGAGVKGVLISITLSEVVGGIASYMWIRYGDWVKPIIKHRALLQTRST